MLLRFLIRGEAIKDESLPEPVSSESGPGDVDKLSLNKDAAEEVKCFGSSWHWQMKASKLSF